MTQTPTMPAERDHNAAKRYIYAFGGGQAEGDATMRDRSVARAPASPR